MKEPIVTILHVLNDNYQPCEVDPLKLVRIRANLYLDPDTLKTYYRSLPSRWYDSDPRVVNYVPVKTMEKIG